MLRCLMLLALAAASPPPPVPADCPTLPVAPGNTLSLDVMPRIGPRPGMPQGGYVGLGLEHVPANGVVCAPVQAIVPRDVLHGDQSTDPLTGRPNGQVLIEMR